MSDKRKHARVRARGVAGHLKTHDAAFACNVENLSEGGMFIRTATPLARGLHVRIDLVKPGLKRSIKLAGRIVYVITVADAAKLGLAAGMAVQFDPVQGDAQDRLTALLVELGIEERHAPEIRREAEPEAKPVRVQFVDRETSEAVVSVADRESLVARVQALHAELAAAREDLAAREQQVGELRDEVKRLRALLRAAKR